MAKQDSRSKLCTYLAFVFAGSLLMTSCKQTTQQTLSTTAETTPAVTTEATIKTDFTVTFQDHNGTVLETLTVAAGETVSAPENPVREGGQFIGWDRNLDCVTGDMIVTAQYAWTYQPTMAVVNTIAKPGQCVKLPIAMVNNPGVAGAKITMVYDPALTLKDSESGEVLSMLDYTQPGKCMSPCSFTWDSEQGMAQGDGTILWLTFEIPADAPAGKTYAVNCVCKNGDMFDEQLVDIIFEAINGKITVE